MSLENLPLERQILDNVSSSEWQILQTFSIRKCCSNGRLQCMSYKMWRWGMCRFNRRFSNGQTSVNQLAQMLRPKGCDAKMIRWVDARDLASLSMSYRLRIKLQSIAVAPSHRTFPVVYETATRRLVLVALNDNVSEMEGAEEACSTSCS